MFGGVSVGPCPWGSSLGAVLAALAAQEGREQGPGEGGGGRGREHLARQQAGERSGWQSVLALGGHSGREQWTGVRSPEEKQLGERELAFIDYLLCAEPLARPCRKKSGLWFLETHTVASAGKCDCS